ncbi:hypothetical protein TNCV_2367981 [Trichonephila clavipes]|nr:hypothetical protein TNCV_2367981 [Trichonephila clavipes]
METDETFQLYLIKYQGVHLSDFITFMTHFQIIVNGLQPPEIIDLYTNTEKRIVELLTKVLPHHHPLDIPCFKAFASFEPKDVSSDYLEQEASKGRGAFIQALWTLYAKSNLYRLAYKARKRHTPQNLTTWTLLAQNGVGWRLCREMARYRVSSARRVLHLSESDALARKDTLWPCVSLAMSAATPGRE